MDIRKCPLGGFAIETSEAIPIGDFLATLYRHKHVRFFNLVMVTWNKTFCALLYDLVKIGTGFVIGQQDHGSSILDDNINFY